MPTSNQISFEELLKASGINYARLQNWCRAGLIDFNRDHGRTRIFEKEETLVRIRFIDAKLRSRRLTTLEEIRKMIEAGEHRKAGK
jgi:DNA-binding transcriptional MerR regulator